VQVGWGGVLELVCEGKARTTAAAVAAEATAAAAAEAAERIIGL
jgi:hypothetical protein